MTCYVVSYRATASEIELIEAIEEVGYGELYQVEGDPEDGAQLVSVSEKTVNFLKTLKVIGKVEKVTIHDGEPTIIEFHDQTSSGYPCLKKRKM